MLERAKRWGVVERNEARNVERLTEEKPDTNWLEVDEATKVIKAARQMVQDPASRCRPQFHALIATFLLTGGRRSEVLGLTRDAVDLDADLVRIEPNDYRSLKTDHSERDVPLWPQLREILAPRLEDHDGGLLFPSPSGGPLTKVRSALDALKDRAEIDKHLTPVVFRHTYASARIQTLDGNAPVHLFTVACELGHRDTDRIEDTYGHLQRRRSRLPEVRYSETDAVDINTYKEGAADG